MDTIHHTLEEQWCTHEDDCSLVSLEESAIRSERKGVKTEEAEAASSASAPSQPVPVKAMPHPQAEPVEPPKDDRPAMPKPPSTPPPLRKIKSETNKQPEKPTTPEDAFVMSGIPNRNLELMPANLHSILDVVAEIRDEGC